MTNFKLALKAYASEIGFDRLGITTTEPPRDFDRYQEWVAKGHAGEMWYLTEPSRMEKRRDLQKILPGAKSVLIGAVSYAPHVGSHRTDAKFARYGWGIDYHNVMKNKLEELATWLSKNSTVAFEYLTYVDTGPILERSLAERAGVGWIGKNTCVMNEKTGSYIFLGEVLTTLELPADSPATNRCGTCTRCLDACPTNAFPKAYELDATKCISYQTIENKNGDIPEDIAKKLDGWVAGCDICQEVCPWNNESLKTRINEFTPLEHTNLTLNELSEISPEKFAQYFGKTSFKRVGLKKMRANARKNLVYLR